MALGHSLGSRTGFGRMRGGLGPQATDAEMFGVGGGVGFGTFGTAAQSMDPRAVARLRTRYADQVSSMGRRIAALEQQLAAARSAMVAVN